MEPATTRNSRPTPDFRPVDKPQPLPNAPISESKVISLGNQRFGPEIDLPIITNGRRCCYQIKDDIFCIKTDLFFETLDLKAKKLIPPDPSKDFTAEYYNPFVELNKLMVCLRKASLEEWMGSETNKASTWTINKTHLFIGYEKGNINVIDLHTKKKVLSVGTQQDYETTHLTLFGCFLLAGFCRRLIHPEDDHCRVILWNWVTGDQVCTLLNDAPGEIEYLNRHKDQVICQVRLKAHETDPEWIRFRFKRRVYLLDMDLQAEGPKRSVTLRKRSRTEGKDVAVPQKL